MIPLLLSEADSGFLSGVTADDIELKKIETPGDWLDIAYQLLKEQTPPDSMFPHDRYVEWLQSGDSLPFPLLMWVSCFTRGHHAYVTGAVSGNLMDLGEPAPAGPEERKSSFIFAIGHQVTSKAVSKAGFKGCGGRLLHAALDDAREHVSRMNGVLCYTVLGARREAVDFYTRMGYRWPQGVSYFNPPLQFDNQGSPACSEAPELLMLRPESPGLSPAEIERASLERVISTIYGNWSLYKARETLPKDAFARAEDYVMRKIFGKTLDSMTRTGPIQLVEIHGDGRQAERKHFRTFALCQGVEHRLEPLKSMDLSSITDFDEMLRVMSGMAFGARTLGEAGEVLFEMFSDPRCKVVLTLSGAASIAKVDLIISEMIERGLIHCIVSTGAIMSHGFNSERGVLHFKVPEGVSDAWLFEHGYDRIYDTIELERSLDEVEQILDRFLSSHPIDRPLSSSDLLRALGGMLVEQSSARGIIQSAFLKNVPIFLPAFSDSELGVDFAIFNYHRRRRNLPEIRFDPYIDFNRYSELISEAHTRGIFTLGGGVPRNWAQQVSTYMDALERRQKGIPTRDIRFSYGVRICPDPPYWGGLSGATYSEGISWGKFKAPDEGSRFAEVYSDFTLVLPLLVKGVLQRLDKERAKGLS